jgi:hypothetical protein
MDRITGVMVEYQHAHTSLPCITHALGRVTASLWVHEGGKCPDGVAQYGEVAGFLLRHLRSAVDDIGAAIPGGADDELVVSHAISVFDRVRHILGALRPDLEPVQTLVRLGWIKVSKEELQDSEPRPKPQYEELFPAMLSRLQDATKQFDTTLHSEPTSVDVPRDALNLLWALHDLVSRAVGAGAYHIHRGAWDEVLQIIEEWQRQPKAPEHSGEFG